MGALLGPFVSAVAQVFLALLLAGIAYLAARTLAGLLGRAPPPLGRWLGLLPPGRPASHLVLVVLAAAALGSALTWGGHTFIPGYAELVTGTAAPYGKTARLGSPAVVLAGVALYAFVQTAISEELLFRGVVARRLVAWLGFFRGNTLQALLFVGVHNAGLALMADVSPLMHMHVLVMVGSMSWAAGWLMERWFQGSIVGAWAAHAGANLGTGLTVWALIS
jgi:uncharacterized protein